MSKTDLCYTLYPKAIFSAETYKKELLAVRSRVLMLDQMHIAKKPKSKKIEKALTTIQRNFKKLEID